MAWPAAAAAALAGPVWTRKDLGAAWRRLIEHNNEGLGGRCPWTDTIRADRRAE